MQLLLYLAAHPGRVLPKEQLLETIWQGAFVSENTLMNAVSELRKALGDDARSPRFIHTHAKRGYRFIAPVRRAESISQGPSARDSRPRVAVEPFSACEPMGAGSGLAGVLTEVVSTLLARSRTVDIVSRLSVSACRSRPCSLPELAERLEAQWILEGAVSRMGGRVRVCVRLFGASDEALWGELMEYGGEPGTAIESAARAILARIESTAAGQ
jgi:TolB-like protein